MASDDELGFTPDVIGEWSERKIRIVKDYAEAYVKILHSKNLKPYYIDGFSGGGIHILKDTGERVLSTARRILNVEPRFAGYCFIDADIKKAAAMKRACEGRTEAVVIHGDANEVLLTRAIPRIEYRQYKRALCFLDPYKILLDWRVLAAAGKKKTIETFIHFPTGDIHRNLLIRDQTKVKASDRERMDLMWGDNSWHSAAFSGSRDLFGPIEVREPFDRVIAAFRERLRTKAGFAFVSDAIPMTNSTNATIYHLMFATQQQLALDIATDILHRESKPKANG
jgi:three-Cys-motif partner protein